MTCNLRHPLGLRHPIEQGNMTELAEETHPENPTSRLRLGSGSQR